MSNSQENSGPAILAVGAHPDDIEFGCGGILLQAAGAGARIHLLVCSRGESGTSGTPAEREAEAREAAALLGASIEFLELEGDGHLTASTVTAMMIAQSIRRVRPEKVLAPTTCRNQHPDHVAVGEATRNAARLARYGGLAELDRLPPHVIGHLLHFAITPAAEPPDQVGVRFDISAVETAWGRLMGCHRTQQKTRNYSELQRTRARAWGLEAGVEYAQVLYANDPFLLNGLAELPPTIRLY